MFQENKFKQKYNPKSNRLQNYDYSTNGWYFITICTKDKQSFFGKIVDGKMILNEYGKIVKKYYWEIPRHFPDVMLDEFIIIPNHIHGILIINKISTKTNANIFTTVETKNFLSLHHNEEKYLIPKWTSRTIGSVIRWFKIGVTKYMRGNTDIYQIWQSNYYDRIIRNDDELQKIRKYIVENPLKWEFDKNNPENLKFWIKFRICYNKSKFLYFHLIKYEWSTKYTMKYILNSKGNKANYEKILLKVYFFCSYYLYILFFLFNDELRYSIRINDYLYTITLYRLIYRRRYFLFFTLYFRYLIFIFCKEWKFWIK